MGEKSDNNKNLTMMTTYQPTNIKKTLKTIKKIQKT